MYFDNEYFQEHYDILKMKSFAQTHIIDWEVLEQLGLANKVWRLVGFNHWLAVFDIDEPIYRELTLEILSTFEVNRTYAHLRRLGDITFQVHCEPRSIRSGEFTVYLDIYDHEFLCRLHYIGLLLDFLSQVEPFSLWRTITRVTGQDSRKAHQYIHALINRSLTSLANTTGVVS